MTLQTPAPVSQLHLTSLSCRADRFHRLTTDGLLDLDPPYQRRQVWTKDQQRLLVKSLLAGIPVPGIILNDRFAARPHLHNNDMYAVVDGKQRILALNAWFDNELDVPASWFPPEDVVTAHETSDGLYVTYDGVTSTAHRGIADASIPVFEARLPDVAAEAAVFVVINRAGTDIDDSLIEYATKIAAQ